MLEWIGYAIGLYFMVGFVLMLCFWVGALSARTTHGGSVLFRHGIGALVAWPVFAGGIVRALWAKVTGRSVAEVARGR